MALRRVHVALGALPRPAGVGTETVTEMGAAAGAAPVAAAAEEKAGPKKKPASEKAAS